MQICADLHRLSQLDRGNYVVGVEGFCDGAGFCVSLPLCVPKDRATWKAYDPEDCLLCNYLEWPKLSLLLLVQDAQLPGTKSHAHPDPCSDKRPS